MSPIVRNILAVIVGLIVGSIVNMALISIGGKVIPPPEGADVTSMEALKATMHLFQPKHFIFPFLAHSIGTLIGALVAAKIAATHKMTYALVIGFVFLVGGVANVFMLPAPTWYNVIDLTLAYIPAAYLGGKIALPKN